MKFSTIAISFLGLAASVSAFTPSPLFARIPHHALRMADDVEEAVSENTVGDFKSKQSFTRNKKNLKVSCVCLIIVNASAGYFLQIS
jgi:hypothetical protein